MRTDKTILELVNEYLRNTDIRENSRQKYRDNLYYYVGWLTRNVDDVRNATKANVIEYKKYLMERKLSAATIENYLVSVRQFYRYLESCGYCDDIAIGVRSLKRSHDIRKEYLSPDQVKTLLQSINRTGLIGQRNYAIVYLMVTTGIRCTEVSRLNISDLSSSYIMVQGKGYWTADRRVEITDMLYDILVQYIEDRGEVDNKAPLFVNHCYYHGRFTSVSISKLIKKLLRSIDLDSPRLTAHSLRHTAAINALKTGCSVTQVRDMLGHRSVITTDLYTRALEAEKSRSNTPVRKLEELYRTAQK